MTNGYVYTAVKERETRIYSVSGASISSGGLTSGWIRWYALLAAFGIILNIILFFTTGGVQNGEIKGTIYVWPFRDSDFKPIPLLLTFVVPGILTTILYSTEIQGYRTSKFIGAFFKPKRIDNKNLRKIKFEKYRAKGLVENINVY